MRLFRHIVLSALTLAAVLSSASCGGGGKRAAPGETSDCEQIPEGVGKLVCMSTSHIAYLDALGCTSIVCGVSGAGYVSNPSVRERYARTLAGDPSLSEDERLYDVGYDAALDYERILSLQPDLVVAYSVGEAVPPYVTKLRSLGVKVLMVNEHLENDPLSRAATVKLFGTIAGCPERADSVYAAVEERYSAIRDSIAALDPLRPQVLFNIPYSDQWYIPGGDNYLSRAVRDAGGEVLGAVPGETRSSVISLENALLLSDRADIWLHPGRCGTMDELYGANRLFRDFPIFKREGTLVFNNTLRSTPEGGNDFWESGAVRPDLVLEDLATIFGIWRGDLGGDARETLHYYIQLGE